ncbi:FFLEELY motif protein [Hydrogenophaga sp. A37]|uniref:FFLEELY motif protein n=1 Tax=Hydrogenophaga sp. A37 TaxID=1945864 RepID=UPI0009D180F7|nr:hypothetical protein [Hydrogenophaga sp. A37]OOG83429.1 hypothetical protein B0E41_12970 [Hydrogenophaga sp. A37]
MSAPNHAAEHIRAHLARVAELRTLAEGNGLASAVHAVKQLQARRFRATYLDFMDDPRRVPATRFFLEELYGEHDFAERDAQFARIAGALERVFPPALTALAVDLAEMHALTETLDHQMAGHWLALGDGIAAPERYVRSWRLTGQRVERERQLAVVQHMGHELQKHTRSKSLLLALRMMRRPAQAAGLSALQQFLESGFAAFATLGDAQGFLGTIAEREQFWVNTLFDAARPTCVQALDLELARI